MTDTVDLEKIASDYVECLLWSSHVYVTEGEDPVEADQYDLSAEAEDECAADVRAFVEANAEDCAVWEAAGFSVGHDFALTRNGHGTGFWDRDYSGGPLTVIGRRLTDASKPYGATDLYLTDIGDLNLS